MRSDTLLILVQFVLLIAIVFVGIGFSCFRNLFTCCDRCIESFCGERVEALSGDVEPRRSPDRIATHANGFLTRLRSDLHRDEPPKYIECEGPPSYESCVVSSENETQKI